MSLEANRQKQLTAAKARNLLNEHGKFLEELANEVIKELDAPIQGTTSDEIALQYMRREGGKDAVKLFMKKINSKTNE